MEGLIVIFGSLAMIAAVGFITAFARGYALSTLWAWFIVPVFGLPPISIVQSIGIALVIGFLTHQQSTQKDEDKKSRGIASITLEPVIHALLTLLVAYIVKSFI